MQLNDSLNLQNKDKLAKTLKKNMDLEVTNDEKSQIEKIISNPESPVGIDAKKTHIIIIHKLLEIEKRLDKLEQKR